LKYDRNISQPSRQYCCKEKAFEVYQRLPDEEVGDYEVLKAQLLKRFRLTEGGYRKKLKRSNLEPGELPEQFVQRLRRYLEKWRVMAGYKAQYDSLEDMILRDLYFLTCGKSLQTFLKEKGKLSLKEMTKTSNNYHEAHGYPKGNQDKKSNDNDNKPYTHGKSNDGEPHGPSNVALRCKNCGLRNHHTSEYRNPKGDQGNTSNMVCFQRNRVGHKQSQCLMLRTNRPHKTAAMQQMTYELSGSKFSPHQCNDCRGEGEIKLACGCMMPVVAGALSPDGQVKWKEWRSQMTPCCKGRVNDTTTLVLRDTGSTTCVVKSSLVKREQMTGSYELCMLIDGVVKRYPTTIVDLDTPYYTGMAKVLCMDTPVQDIIVGNIPGAHGPDTDTKPRDIKYTSQCIADTPLSADKQSGENVLDNDKTPENKKDKSDVAIEECTAI